MAAVTRLTRQLSEERASVLATEAIQLAKSGRLEHAAARLREAAALGHDNADVQAAFIALHQNQNESQITELCRRYAQYHDAGAGDEAVKYLLHSPDAKNLSSSIALESLNLILDEPPHKLSEAQDVIISSLARSNIDVRRYVAAKLTASTTEFFENMFARGDESPNVLRNVVLEASHWQDEATRLRVEDDLFVLFIAKLMESGHDHDGRALKGITLLLLADTARLYHHIDEDAFDALLTSLDFRQPPEVRGQATLVISKFMEIADTKAHTYFSNFVTSQIARNKADALVISFSAAAQLFSIATAVTAQLFLTEGFLQNLMPLLQQKFSSPMVHDSFLSLLNAACLDGACRKAINEHCATWLSHKVSNGVGRQPAMAATILAKLRTANARGAGGADQSASNENVSDLVDLFQKSLVVQDEPEKEKNISDSVEGLAYTSLRPEVKERIANDQKLLKALLEALEKNPSNPEIVVGGLSTIANLAQYQPVLSEEQKKMSQLRAYANASKPALEDSKLESDTYVEKRCTALVNAGVTATLVKLNKISMSGTPQLTDKILLNLSRNKTHRGTLAQQGAVRLLITHYQRSQNTTKTQPQASPASPTPPTPQPALDAAHALARILISLNPTHLFPANQTPHITAAVPPLASLLKPAPTSDTPIFSSTTDQPRDLLPVFESLLALTNLASAPQPDIAPSIIRVSFPDIEDLLLSTSNTLVRRAAVELICNLVAYPAGIILYADTSRRALERLRILVAMGDVDDEKTRSAAGGALAMLTEYEEVRKAMVEDSEKIERTCRVVLEMVGDEDVGLKHRGFVVMANLLEGEQGRGDVVKGIIVDKLDGVEKVKGALREVRDQGVLEIGIEVLKKLMGKT